MKKETYEKILIGITLIAIALGIRPHLLKAATLTPTTTQYDARYGQITCTNACENFIFVDNGSYQGTVNMGTAISTPASNYSVNQLSLKYYYSNNFVAGNTYLFKIRVNTSYARYSDFQKFQIINVKGGNSTSELDNGNIQSNAINSVNVDDSDDKVYYMTISVTPLTNIKYIWIYIGYKPMTQTFRESPLFGNIVVRNAGVSYSEGVGSQIDQQTQVIIEQTEIIENAIENSTTNIIEGLKEQNMVCKDYGINDIKDNNQRIIENGEIQNNQNEYGITDYIKVDSDTIIKVKKNLSIDNRARACFYNINKQMISCVVVSQLIQNQIVSIPNNASYFRSTIYKNTQEPIYEICKNGNQAIIDEDHNYNGADIGTQVDQYEQQEEEIETITDVDLTDRLTLNWNTGTLSWIWTTFDTIRGSYLKVFALMTSFLALGIIRLVLGR